jgi:prephenate dehydrogenase
MEAGFRRVGIWGVGLIGGSLGLAIKRFDPRIYLLGVGRDPERLEIARNLGAVDSWQTEQTADLRDCDLVVLATPVEHILSTVGALGDRLQPEAVVTDVGSTKRRTCAEAWAHFPTGVEFIGGHPVAGREVAGVENSSASLFAKAPYVLCPRAGAALDSLQRLRALVERLGAQPWIMSPEEHDHAIAWLSHIPQLLSTALADLAGKENLGIAGSGFRDMIRLAGSPYSVWKSIVETNQDHVDRFLGEFIEYLERMRSALRKGSLSAEFARAVEVYERLKADSGR